MDPIESGRRERVRRWWERVTLCFGVLAVFGWQPSWASPVPSPYSSVTLIAFPISIIALTALGGGYALMRTLGRKRHHRYMNVLGALVIIFSSFISVAMNLLGTALFAVIAILQGGRMIAWAFRRSVPPQADDSPPLRVRPARLALAGTALILATAFFTGQAFAFIMWDPAPDTVEEHLRDLVAYQIHMGKQHEISEGRVRFEPLVFTRTGGRQVPTVSNYIFYSLSPDPPFRTGMLPNAYRMEFTLGQDARSFRVWVWPDRFPDFPYAQLYRMTLPSFYADESGNIRATRVNQAGQRCPEDAPISYRVNDQDLHRMARELDGAANQADPADITKPTVAPRSADPNKNGNKEEVEQPE
jgi:hypothetical protein